jgi:phosphatidylglycerol---prolipoprotein diacylglyceryl transferase
MCPILFHIGNFPVRSFGIVLVLGFISGIFWAKSRASRYAVDPSKVWDAAFWMMVFGVLGARLAFILQDLGWFLKHPKELTAIQFNGLTSFGGLILGFVALVVWSRTQKLKLLTLMDIFGAPVLLAHGIGRFGCLLNGCCYGHQTKGGFGVHVDALPGLYQPAQVYDAAMVFAAAILVVLFERRNTIPGRSAALAIGAYGLSRFIYEFWRAGSELEVRAGVASSTYWGTLPITQAQAMAVVTVGVATALFLASKEPRNIAQMDSEDDAPQAKEKSV